MNTDDLIGFLSPHSVESDSRVVVDLRFVEENAEEVTLPLLTRTIRKLLAAADSAGARHRLDLVVHSAPFDSK